MRVLSGTYRFEVNNCSSILSQHTFENFKSRATRIKWGQWGCWLENQAKFVLQKNCSSFLEITVCPHLMIPLESCDCPLSVDIITWGGVFFLKFVSKTDQSLG